MRVSASALVTLTVLVFSRPGYAQFPASVPPNVKRPQPIAPRPNPEGIPPRHWVPHVPEVPLKGGPKPAAPGHEKEDKSDPASLAPIDIPSFPIRRYTLPNGLRVVVSPDHAAPTVAVAMTYGVGSRDEERGRSGFAHFFEHMMFQGTRNIRRGEHFSKVASVGGVLNGRTFTDHTRYETSVPAHALPLVLWLEADRMKGLDFTPANFANQRDVIKEELRLRVDNAAYVPSYVRLIELVYRGVFPYEHTPLGSFIDLDQSDPSQVEAFFRAHYRPDNATLAIVGDVEDAAVDALIASTFRNIKAPKENRAPFVEPKMPEQTTPRGDVVADAYAELPMWMAGWATARAGTRDHAALAVLATLLGGSEHSRLHAELIQKRGIAVEVNAQVRSFGTADPFTVTIQMATGHRPDEARTLFDKEWARLVKDGVTKDEVDRAKRHLATSAALQLEPFTGRANALADAEMQFGNAEALRAQLANIVQVSADDVTRVARTYLTEARRSAVDVRVRDLP